MVCPMKHRLIISFIVISLFLAPSTVLPQLQCVDASGEATIKDNDIPSARLEAIARAKWDAIEKTVGVDVTAGSFVSNFTLIEDVMKTQVGGSIKRFTVKTENVKDGIMTVNINACVEPKKARDAIITDLSLNSGVAVFIPVRKPSKTGTSDEYEETNYLTESLIEKLTEQHYRVIDVAPTQVADAAEIENAVRTGRTLTVRSLMYKFLSNILIIGKTDYTVSTKKGEDIGYGLSMPFNNVTVRLTYRIVARNNKTGNTEVLTAGTEQGKGLHANLEDAAAIALREVSEKVTPKILDKIATYLQENTRRIRVKVEGVKDLDTNMEVKSLLQNIVWVSEVEEKGMGEYLVSYPEKTIYLANSLQQQGNFQVTHFSPYALTLKYKKEGE